MQSWSSETASVEHQQRNRKRGRAANKSIRASRAWRVSGSHRPTLSTDNHWLHNLLAVQCESVYPWPTANSNQKDPFRENTHFRFILILTVSVKRSLLQNRTCYRTLKFSTSAEHFSFCSITYKTKKKVPKSLHHEKAWFLSCVGFWIVFSAG